MPPAAKDKPLESHPGVVRSQLSNGFKIVYLENEYPNDRLSLSPDSWCLASHPEHTEDSMSLGVLERGPMDRPHHVHAQN